MSTFDVRVCALGPKIQLKAPYFEYKPLRTIKTSKTRGLNQRNESKD